MSDTQVYVGGQIRPRHRVYVLSGSLMSTLNAIIIVLLVIFWRQFEIILARFSIDWFLYAWAIFESFVVMMQLPQLVGRKPLVERKEVSDVFTSSLDAAAAWLVVPAIYFVSAYYTGWYWPPKGLVWLWGIALIPALIDFLLLLILLEIAKTVVRPQLNR